MASAAWRAVAVVELPPARGPARVPARVQALAASLGPPRVLVLERAVVLSLPLVLVLLLAALPS